MGIRFFLRCAGMMCLAGSMILLPLPGRNLPEKWAGGPKSGGENARPSVAGPIIKMNPLVVNLSEPSGRHYLKATVVLELGKREWVEEVQKRIPCLTDMMISTLGDKKLAEMQDPRTKEGIRKELLEKAQKLGAGSKILQIYFDEFLYQ